GPICCSPGRPKSPHISRPPAPYSLPHASRAASTPRLLALGRLGSLELWGTARGEHAALVRELGATPIDYQREDFTRVLPGGFDLVFDGIGEEGYRRSFTVLKRGGLLCASGYSAGVQAQRRMLTMLMWIARLYLWRWLPGGKRARFYSINVMRARHTREQSRGPGHAINHRRTHRSDAACLPAAAGTSGGLHRRGLWSAQRPRPIRSCRLSFFLSGQISRSYASTNRRDRCATYQTVCGKRATLLDNADRANRNPRRGLELNNGRNVKRSAIRAWGGNTTLEYDRWAANTGRLEGATAEKA